MIACNDGCPIRPTSTSERKRLETSVDLYLGGRLGAHAEINSAVRGHLSGHGAERPLASPSVQYVVVLYFENVKVVGVLRVDWVHGAKCRARYSV